MAASQKVLIFGGSGGIGSSLARMLHAEGASLFVAGRNASNLESLAIELGCRYGCVDASDPDAVDAMADQANEILGGLDGVANCVGSLLLKPAHLTSTADWNSILFTNLSSAFGCVRSAGRIMRQTGGSVVLVSSAAARVGLTNHEAIAAAKAGVEGLTRSAAATYARYGIRLNAVAPGLTKTPLTRSLLSSELAEKASIAMHPLGRLGEPQDVASAIAWLLNPQQRWITGQVIGVDGGLADLRSKA